FCPSNTPLTPMYIVHSPMPAIIKLVQLEGMAFFASNPILLPTKTVRVFTMTPNITLRPCPQRCRRGCRCFPELLPESFLCWPCVRLFRRRKLLSCPYLYFRLRKWSRIHNLRWIL